MNVYLLIEEIEQEEYSDANGWPPPPVQTVMGVYSSREKAEKEKEVYDRAAKENVEKFNCDSCSYLIEERPVL